MATDPSKYVYNHTMIRVKDPKASVEFYEKVLGMKNIYKEDFESGKFTVYFFVYTDNVPETEKERKRMVFTSSGVLELTHNWGTENQADFKYCTGNDAESKGFGHIALLVDDIEAACERAEKLNVKFVKRLTDGKMKNIAFIADPDGYWVEFIQNPLISDKYAI
ncbi:lactoylglutathione lyase [Absidia repens]|uniref:Lactoylglutathione lyase n=1 Tax=Absidia repens TaxID=90262 RepID=A0A1X2J0U8_9FUNG|nr:lactoylglutathione lyase [Absidia repens]